MEFVDKINTFINLHLDINKIKKKAISEINNDLDSLVKTWDQIKEVAINSIAPTLIHHESEIINRTLRDIFKFLYTLYHNLNRRLHSRFSARLLGYC